MTEAELAQILTGIAESMNSLKDHVFTIKKILIDRELVTQEQYDALREEFHEKTHPLNAIDLERLLGLGPSESDEEKP